jgi:serine/threonine-protein kinase
MVWQAGQSLKGNRYIIQRKIGSGGFGITYLAQDGKGRQWVVKTLKDEVMTSDEYADYRDKYIRDFEREATRLGFCRHPHIVQIENAFTHQDFPCIVMEYIQGIDLWQRLKKQGALSEAEAVRYIRQIGEALIVVHDKGLLHRDINPKNIMVRDSIDEAVLIDFGIAREFIPDLTQTHTKYVKSGFAPVEQYDDRAHRGEFTDVYALAATLANLVTGRFPQPSFNRVIRDNFQIPTEVSPKVQEAIKQGMIINPEDRIQTVEAFLEILQVNPIKAQVSARYRQLEALLAAGKWQEADQETAKVILEVANRTEQGQLDVASIDNFSCEDLKAIDGLWVKYSKGRFGFSVQKRIYQSLGGTREYDQKVWDAFADQVGWQKEGGWTISLKSTFDVEPDGYLPWTIEVGNMFNKLIFENENGLIDMCISLLLRRDL